MDLESVEQLRTRLDRLARTREPAAVAALATDVLEALRVLQQEVSAARDDAVLALHGEGATLHDIARSAGLTRGRVFQIVQRGREPGTDRRA